MMKLTARFAFLCWLPATLCAADPFIGTWKINPAKSAFPGIAPFSMEMRFDAAGENELNSWNQVQQFSGGKLETDVCLWKLDGRKHVACNPAMIAARRRIDDHHIQALVNSTSTVVSHQLTYEVSEDGRKLTIIAEGVAPQGHYRNVVVYDRQ